MPDAMVVARMPQEKKDSVARILESQGTNASRVINELYDFIDAHHALPFEKPNREEQRSEREAQACVWLAGIVRLPEGNGFQSLADEDITRLRLQARGYKV